MFSHSDLYERVDNNALINFHRIVERMDLLDVDQSPIRDLYLTAECHDELFGWNEKLVDGAIAELTRFIAGSTVYWGDLREGNHIKPLNPQTNWVEFKHRTSPQTRIYGGFVERDLLICIHACYREHQPDIDPFMGNRWHSLWGEDIPRMRITQPNELLSKVELL